MDLKPIVEQFLKFGIVGVSAFAIDYAMLMFLSQALGWNPVLSSVISFTLSVVFNYVASMRYVFERRDDLSRRREFTMFVVLSTVGLVINSICMWGGIQELGHDALAVSTAKVLSALIVALWNFWSRKHWLEAKQRS